MEANSGIRFIAYAFAYGAGVIAMALPFMLGGAEEIAPARDVVFFFAAILIARHAAYAALSFWFDISARRRALDRGDAGHSPRATVIVRSSGDLKAARSTAKSLVDSAYRNAEIVIADEGPFDAPDDVIADFFAHYESGIGYRNDMRMRYFRGTADTEALDAAIDSAEGDIVIFIQAGHIASASTVGGLIEEFRDERVSATVGGVAHEFERDFIGSALEAGEQSETIALKAESAMNAIRSFGDRPTAVRRDVLASARRACADRDRFMARLPFAIHDSGGRIAFAPTATVRASGMLTFAAFAIARTEEKRRRLRATLEYGDLFFSRRKWHGKLLSWFALPFGFIADIELSFEIMAIAMLYAHAAASNDYTPMAAALGLITAAVFAGLATEDSTEGRADFLLLSPTGWIAYKLMETAARRTTANALGGLASRLKPAN